MMLIGWQANLHRPILGVKICVKIQFFGEKNSDFGNISLMISIVRALWMCSSDHFLQWLKEPNNTAKPRFSFSLHRDKWATVQLITMLLQPPAQAVAKSPVSGVDGPILLLYRRVENTQNCCWGVSGVLKYITGSFCSIINPAVGIQEVSLHNLCGTICIYHTCYSQLTDFKSIINVVWVK